MEDVSDNVGSRENGAWVPMVSEDVEVIPAVTAVADNIPEAMFDDWKLSPTPMASIMPMMDDVPAALFGD